MRGQHPVTPRTGMKWDSTGTWTRMWVNFVHCPFCTYVAQALQYFVFKKKICVFFFESEELKLAVKENNLVKFTMINSKKYFQILYFYIFFNKFPSNIL